MEGAAIGADKQGYGWPDNIICVGTAVYARYGRVDIKIQTEEIHRE